MNPSTQDFVQSLANRFAGDCRAAESRVARQRTIPDAVRAASVSCHPVLRGIARSLPCVRSLNSAVDRHLNALIDQQLASVRKEDDLAKRKEMLGHLRMREWEHLRGKYAMQWRRADAEAHRLLNP